MMQFSIEIGWWIAFLVMSLFFSGMEVAFVASDKLRYAVNKKEKGVYNFMLNTIYSHPRQFLSTLVVANHIVLAFSFILRWLSCIIESSTKCLMDGYCP